MRELGAILSGWRSLDKRNGGSVVLATVVHVTGSSYRRPGGRMLFVPDGRHIGCVSGGCLEGEIVRKARWFTESGAPVLRVCDTTPEEQGDWEFGLGCTMIEFLAAHRAARQPAVVATAI